MDATLPNVKILPVKVMGDDGTGTSLSMYNGVMFAAQQNCDVINMSLGGFGKSELEEEAVLAAVSENISVVVAAGNERVDAMMCSPANIEEAITVGAITEYSVYAYYSNYGSVVDIWAPGDDVKSSIPGNKFAKKSGTSMASPHVAAAAAMLKTYDKALSPRQIEGALQKYAKELRIVDPVNTETSKVLSVETLKNFRKESFTPVEKPQADVNPGVYYQNGLVVSLSCATPGATIRYTTDSTIPTATSGEVYTGPLTLRQSTRLIAKAFKEGAIESYTLDNLYCVSAYPESLHYQKYSYYDTWEYTYPDTNAKYLKVTFDENSYIPFPSVNSAMDYHYARLNKYGLYIYDANLKAVNNEYADIERKYFVYDELQGKSVIVPGNSFTILLNCSLESSDYGFKVKSVEPLYEARLSAPKFVTPCGNDYYTRQEYATFMMVGGSNINYAENKTVVLNSKEGGDIYYTLDGSIPTKSSLKYTGPITLDEPKKIRARAYKDGYVESEAVSENYYSSKYPETMHYQKRDYYFKNGWEWFAPSDVKYMAITFDDKTFLGARDSSYHLDLCIYSDIYDIGRQWPTTFYGTELAGQTIYIQGNYFKLFCGGNFPEGVDIPYGFKITNIRYYYNEDDIIPIESIEISGPDTIAEGQPTQMTAKVTPENTNTGFFWRMASTSPSAVIDKSGVITGINKGTYKLLATSKFVNSIRTPDDNALPNYRYNGDSKNITVTSASAPVGIISYSTTLPTNQNVVATIMTNSGTKVRNNGGSNTYTFTENGEFTFEFKGAEGHKGSATAKVTWIDRTLEIYSPEDLVTLAERVNTGDSLTGYDVLLMQDIDMSGINWTPMGNNDKYNFSGTFDGQNFTIYNLGMNNSSLRFGLFGQTTEDAVIRNVRLENCSLVGSNNGSIGGGIVGYNKGIVENCSVSGEINGVSYVGGIVGRNAGKVLTCCMAGTVTGTDHDIGGITGFNANGYFIENCFSAGKIRSTSNKNYMGGIAGESSGTIKNCYSVCAIENTEANGQYYGGIAGRLSGKCYLQNCVALNPYVIALNSDKYIGRIISNYHEIFTLSDNYAWSGMLLGTEQDKTPVTDDAVPPLSYINGKGVDKAEVHTKEFWETAGFTFGDDAWTWTEGKMPSLAISEPLDWPKWLLIDEYHISYENGNVTAEVAEAGTYTIILAAYKEETLISVEIVEEVFENPGKKVITPARLQTDGADTVKVMLWDSADSMRPLCETDECSL